LQSLLQCDWVEWGGGEGMRKMDSRVVATIE
jgi:hypothetical protein